MNRLISAVAAGACALVLAVDSQAQDFQPAQARLMDVQGREVGLVRLHEAPSRGVLLRVEVAGLAPGLHAIHIHEAGRCEPPLFSSAGSRAATGRELSLRVPGEGKVEVERLAARVTLASGLVNSLLDEDGSAILIYATLDEHAPVSVADPNPPVLCGVIRR
jgi:Cu-Zn family superoxide dismutase